MLRCGRINHTGHDQKPGVKNIKNTNVFLVLFLPRECAGGNRDQRERVRRGAPAGRGG